MAEKTHIVTYTWRRGGGSQQFETKMVTAQVARQPEVFLKGIESRTGCPDVSILMLQPIEGRR